MLPRPFSIAACCLPLLMFGSAELAAQVPAGDATQPPSRVGAPTDAASVPATTGSLPPVEAVGAAAEPATEAEQAQATSAAPAPNSDETANPPAGKQPSVALDPVPGGDGVPDPLTPKETAEPAPAAPGTPVPLTSPAAIAAAIPSDPAEMKPDPVVAEVTRLLADPNFVKKQSAAAADRDALKSYYEGSGATLIWITSSGFNARGQQAIAEMARADDWGLRASEYKVVSTLSAGAVSQSEMAEAEIGLGLAVLSYARHARGGRVDPTSISNLIDRRPRIYDPKTVLQAIAATPAADSYLQSLHPKHPQFEKLRQALLAIRKASDTAKADEAKQVEIPNGPRIRPGASHAQVALVRQRLGLPSASDSDAYDDDLVAAVKAFQSEHGQRGDGIIDADLRSALNGKPRASSKSDIARLEVNMERWRWMPDELGEFHVWASVTEQKTSVVKRGEIVFSEKIIVGKPKTATPSFSADMKFVIFHPDWGVPNGIKTNELAPHLRRASPATNDFFSLFGGGGGSSASRVLERFGGLVPNYNGRPVNPDAIDWSRVDIRQFNFRQPPGPRNVLGIVKFRFPNKHDVYMHDTPERHLFNGNSRAFSHGCMRVQNPMRLAEVILDYDKGWSSERVHSMVDSRSTTTDVTLEKRVPVHIAYFTAVAEDDGKVRYSRDLYGLDSRVASALEGRRVDVAARAEPVAKVVPSSSEETPPQTSKRRRATQQRQQRPPSRSSDNPFAGLFNN